MSFREDKLAEQGRNGNPGKKLHLDDQTKDDGSSETDLHLAMEKSEVADYLVSMLQGLQQVAIGAEFEMVARLIGMAILEAQDQKTQSDSP